MTTTATRDLAAIAKSRAFVANSIEQMEATLSEVRGLAVTNTIYVLGWLAYGLFLNSKNEVGGLLWARRFDNAHTPCRMTVTNGSGERAAVVTLGRAREVMIERFEDVLTMLNGQLQDLDIERENAEFAEFEALKVELEAMTAKAAKLERELARHRRAVEVALDHFDDHADADCDQDGYVPNCELRASSHMRAILEGLA